MWFDVLENIPWQRFVPIAVEYYEALWRFKQAKGLLAEPSWRELSDLVTDFA